MRSRILCACALAGAALPSAWAEPSPTQNPDLPIEEIVVVGRREDLVGTTSSASMGRVGRADLDRIPFLRTGEILEVVPGLVATQHSGTGKANQLFLRGFDLDHGTDFSTSLEGVPLNLPTHGHGQGYLDLNSVIPEIVEVVEFRKGPYFAAVGDFASAGTSAIEYVRTLPSFVETSFGEDGFSRTVAAISSSLGGGDLLVAGVAHLYDGPWGLDEDLENWNGVLKWTRGDDAGGISLLASAYSADWRSTDQIPRRAVARGLVDRLGNLDDDLGGETSRHTGSARWWQGGDDRQTRVQAYFAVYELDLWSNFTYFLDDPENGDEFEQIDERTLFGLDAAHEVNVDVRGLDVRSAFGLQARHDEIRDVGLFRTVSRRRIDVVRRDEARVTALGLWWSAETRATSWLRPTIGVRGDLHRFDVDASVFPENAGNEVDSIVSPKVGVALGPWSATELYASYGRGLHSNDARGTTIRIDPSSGERVSPVDPLVASHGAEVGIRSTRLPGLHSTMALWWLDLDSELIFVGDAGTTEASRPSRRYGLEIANHWVATPWLVLDADVTFTESEFRDPDPAGEDIPGTIGTTLAAGAAMDLPLGLFGSLRLRHFGARPLVEDRSVESEPTTIVNLMAGWRGPALAWGSLALEIDVLNLLDARNDDIAYVYASRLPGEPEDGVEDVHFHPVEPRTARGSLRWTF